jgi:hypothetical protein
MGMLLKVQNLELRPKRGKQLAVSTRRKAVGVSEEQKLGHADASTASRTSPDCAHRAPWAAMTGSAIVAASPVIRTCIEYGEMTAFRFRASG